ncbi:hypothetical protein BDD12DRAFT_881997 [Trichophaea hybrida]|nr:hypothetical protein BDD12DRAFT_881997 [Trichophaea hybrida]
MSQPSPKISAPFSQLRLSPSSGICRSQFIEQYAPELCDDILTREQLTSRIESVCPILETNTAFGPVIAQLVKAVVEPLSDNIKASQRVVVEELRDDKK